MDYRQPDLSVITVNYNGFHDTCEFIDSWTATIFSVSYEMIVIDNGSTANEAALLQKTYPFIQAVRSEQNLGFAGGNNLGINLAKGMNPIATPMAGFMLRAVHRHKHSPIIKLARI